ncbi:MAG TPA: hypothetical protein DCS43_00545 [Verrucomicrobia bacterium]|nr:hypothetical protein [Verrucomicrobiota bacterium]
MDFFFISSTLHLMMAANMAIQDRSRKRIAVIIAKDTSATARYAMLAGRFPNLFDEVVALSPLQGPSWRCLSTPRFRTLKTLFTRPMDARLFTGNDRRIEFQYAMHIAMRANRGRSIEGVYLDEGAVTYVGHKSMHTFQHRYVDPFFKKLFYGGWYRQALTTGTSAWVNTVYAAFPDRVHPLLQLKVVLLIDPQPFKTDAFKALAVAMLNGHDDYREALSGIRLVLTLPHEGSYTRNPEHYQQISQALLSVYAPASMAIKPHPRITDRERIETLFPGFLLLDHTVGMEALLPLLGDGCRVVGDISSTLLTTRWLRPDLPVVAVLAATPPAELSALYQHLQIPMVAPGELNHWLGAH